MAVSSTTNKVSYTATASQTTFAYTFKIFADGDLNVYVNDVLKTLTTDYTVTGAGNASGGNVVFGTGLSASDEVVIERVLDLTQGTDYVENDPFPAETHEDALDRLTFIAQQHQDALDRSVKFATTVTDAGDVEVLGSATARANKLFAFDSSGDLDITQEIGVYQGNWAASTAYIQRDIIKDTSNNNIYICLTGHTSSGSQPISTNTDSAKWALIVDAAAAASSASAASTSATAAASSATAAASSASAAATSETNAATSESNASASETAASTAQTAAETAQTAAEAAQTAAEAVFDNFDDAYLGAKASDPTVDNDGDALTDGDLYFDTTNNVMKVYDLGTTTWYQLTPTVSNQTNINTVAGISSDVSTVAGISSDVTTVSSISGNTTTVAGISSNVTTVAGISANVTAVAGDATDIGTVATDLAGSDTIGTVATNITNVNSVATNSTNINTVAGISSNVTTVAGISSNVTTVAGISSDVTAVAGDATDIGTVATNIANVNSVGGSITNVNTVATNLTSVNNFAAQYRVSATEPTTSLDDGDLWFDTTNDVMKVYSGSGWVNAGSSVNGTSARFKYTATSGQTTFTGADDNANTLAYDAGYIDVFLNGVHLDPSDYTATSGSSIVLASGAAASDELYVVAFGTFSVSTHVLKTGDTMSGNLNFGDNDKAQFGAGNDLQIYHNGSHSFITDAGTGNLYVDVADRLEIRNTATEKLGVFNQNGSVDLYYDNALKLQTSSTGIDVTGSVTSDGLTVDGSGAKYLNIGSTDGSGAYIYLDGSSNGDFLGGDYSVIKNENNDLVFISGTPNGDIESYTHDGSGNKLRHKIRSNGDIYFYEDTGTSAKLFWKAAEEQLSVKGAIRSLTRNYGSSASPGADEALVYHDNTTQTDPTGMFFHNSFQSNSSSFISFRTRNNGAAQERMRILSSGGITFNGDTATANALDDYEEGTWTPILQDQYNNQGTLTSSAGYYSKVGNQVTLWMNINLSSKASMSGNTLVGGLPFSIKDILSTTANDGAGAFGQFGNLLTNASWLGIRATQPTNLIEITYVPAAGATVAVNLPTSNIGNTFTFRAMFTYIAT